MIRVIRSGTRRRRFGADAWARAVAGAVYGLLYLKKGLLAAIVAHALTNLALGLYVLKTGAWQFW